MKNIAYEKNFVLYQVFKKYTNGDSRDLCENIIKVKKMALDSLQEEIRQGIQFNYLPPIVKRQSGYSQNADAGYHYGINM